MTLPIDASLIHRAVVVNRAGAICAATDIRVSLETSLTTTDVKSAFSNTRSSFSATFCPAIRSHRRFFKSTFDAGISRWIIGWTEADGTVSFDSALGVKSTAGIGARIDRGRCCAKAAPDGIANASR